MPPIPLSWTAFLQVLGAISPRNRGDNDRAASGGGSAVSAGSALPALQATRSGDLAGGRMSMPGSAASAAASGGAGASSLADRRGGDFPAVRSPLASPARRMPIPAAQQTAPEAVAATPMLSSPTGAACCQPSFDMSDQKRAARAAAVGLTTYSLCRREPRRGDSRLALMSALAEADDGNSTGGNVVALPDILR